MLGMFCPILGMLCPIFAPDIMGGMDEGGRDMLTTLENPPIAAMMITQSLIRSFVQHSHLSKHFFSARI